jgi:F-type H+-transporting ATPase subunit delta
VIGYVLARRYARAIIDLAQETGQVTEIGEELSKIAALFAESPELVYLFTDPTVGAGKKERVLKDLLGKGNIRDLTQRFVHVLLSKNRLLGIGEIAMAYRDYSDRLNNRIRARIISASPLDKGEVERIRKTLTGIAQQEVVLELEVDENILGGIVAYVGSQVYDGSVKNQLQQIRENLSKGR